MPSSPRHAGQAAVTQGGERIQPRRGVVDSERVTTPGEERKNARDLVEIAADKGESQQRRLALPRSWPKPRAPGTRQS
jgi:hypothetical protein